MSQLQVAMLEPTPVMRVLKPPMCAMDHLTLGTSEVMRAMPRPTPQVTLRATRLTLELKAEAVRAPSVRDACGPVVQPAFAQRLVPASSV